MKKNRILICDDDRDILEVTSMLLSMLNYEVVVENCCNNDIVEKVIAYAPDLVLMDLWLPEIGGEAATIKLKADPRTRHIPIVIFSAVNNTEAIAKRVSADAVLNKPYDIYELEELINTLLNPVASG